MKKVKVFLFGLFMSAALLSFAVNIGDPAPELQIGKWIKNGPAKITEGRGKKTYIIEFWTTDCKPCLEAIPYLNELQEQYKDQGVTVISISTEKADIVKNFIAGKKINYTVAVDDNKKSYRQYMPANASMPAAFIVDKSGTVAWMGNPLDMALPLKRIVTGKFNIQESAQRDKAYRKIQRLFSQKKYSEAMQVTEEELKSSPDSVQLVAVKAFLLFQLNKKDEALAFTDKILQKHPINMELFELKAYILNQMKKYKELDAFYMEFINNCKDEPMLLNQLTRKLLGTRFGEAKLAPAMRAAELAYSSRKLSKLQRAQVGETLARIYYMIGRIDRAIKIQKIVHRTLKENKKPRFVYALRILEYYQQAEKLGRGPQIK